MKKIIIHPSPVLVDTEVFIGENILTENLLKGFCKDLKVVIIADVALKDLYGLKLAKSLRAELLTIPSGERFKTKETQEQVMGELFKMGAGRDTVLIALGGGVITDLVGFISSIYMRGIPLILIPTTLLAMVDAAIGGKTAIDTPFGKNLIGTIYHPKAIFISLDLLKTLPEKEWFNGFAEILKMGLIRDSHLCELFKKNKKDPELIVRSMKGKIEIVQQDLTEQSMRRILNFGHTIGHGLETIAAYEMPHGEAVAIGCLVESYLSMHLGYLPKEIFEQIQELYKEFSLELPKTYERESLLKALFYDKKKENGLLRFILINRIGHAISFEGSFCRPVTLNELESSLNWMENTYG